MMRYKMGIVWGWEQVGELGRKREGKEGVNVIEVLYIHV
jgi:hypothetical protein